MLERLNDVPWGELNHAYGPAGDVPKNIRDLASRSANKREGALDALLWTLCHQGTVYSATAPAVPFLLELAASDQVKDRQAILQLLAYIASGSGYLEVHSDMDSE